jgi:hypothetical protein
MPFLSLAVCFLTGRFLAGRSARFLSRLDATLDGPASTVQPNRRFG